MEELRMKLARVIAGAGVVFGVVGMLGAPRVAGRGTDSGDPVKGKQVYLSANPKCSACHKIGDSGGKLGPDLSTVGTKRDAAWLAKYLPNPKITDPKNKMPPVKATGKDLEDLIAYLVSLKGK
jgi:mono/diheme cytochrome c family protein